MLFRITDTKTGGKFSGYDEIPWSHPVFLNGRPRRREKTHTQLAVDEATHYIFRRGIYNIRATVVRIQ